MHSRNTFSLLTFSVSRIPFREDPPADIIPPPWADRSVVQKSYLAANSSKKYLKYSFSCQFMRVRKIFVQVGTFYNELNCSSSLLRVSGTVILGWTLVQWMWTFGCICSSEKLYESSSSFKEIILYIPKVRMAQLFCDGLWLWSCSFCYTAP